MASTTEHPSPPLSSSFPPQTTMTIINPSDICAVCGYPGADVRIKSCPSGSAYHARCLDLVSIKQTNAKLEMVPLSFIEIDNAQRMSMGQTKKISGGSMLSTSPGTKRMHSDIFNNSTSSSSKGESKFYDYAEPRTGKWSNEEIAFRDSLVPKFVDGSLPLSNGLKLIDFLSTMLKSKPSRLTKKMKHAKLSTRHFHLNTGCIKDISHAKEISRLEVAFINSIFDPIERSEIQFHMQKEWRDHLAERLTSMRIPFDANEWLKSVDKMDTRITLAKSRNRMVKRRIMMGKAIEKDTSSPTPGIFIDNTLGSGAHEDVDFDLLASALETNDAEDADLGDLMLAMLGDIPSNVDGVNSGGNDTGAVQQQSLSLSSNAESSSAQAQPFRSALLPNLGSTEGPNFRFAAPFLAKITGYIENNRVPFEHIDIWVPSSSNGYALDPTGNIAPEPPALGSGSAMNPSQGKVRLCFAGSASVEVQIVDEADQQHGDGTPPPSPFDHKMHGQNLKAVPLSSEEIYHLSLFGTYSEKFSFTSGCGLPGRVFESAIPAWEQFICNAPSHLFERRGGAMQFGINTAVALPISSPNAGRIVLVMYSRHNRVKDDDLVRRMIQDFEAFNPSPRWKLIVDMQQQGTNTASQAVSNPVQQQNQGNNNSQAAGNLSAALGDLSEKSVQIFNLIALLGENMPSDISSPLGEQIQSMMSLRMLLLKKNRDAEEEDLIDSILMLFDSYVKAGRSRPDMTLMLARDFGFHVMQHAQMQQQTAMQRQVSISAGLDQHQPGQHQPQEPPTQLDHTHHGEQQDQHQTDQSDSSRPATNTFVGSSLKSASSLTLLTQGLAMSEPPETLP